MIYSRDHDIQTAEMDQKKRHNWVLAMVQVVNVL